MADTKILVSGASVAGPALAFWLTRYGFQVTVVERAPSLRPGGQAVDLRGTAREVARRMGLDERIRAACTHTEGETLVDRKNRPKATLRADDFGGDGPIAEIEILRGDLTDVLYEATKEKAEYVFDDRITALDERADGVDVTFASGTRKTFDVVIGADGLHSGVRALAFGEESRFVRHLGSYLAFFTVPNRLGLRNWAVGFEDVGRSAGIRAIRDGDEAMAYFGFASEKVDYDHRDVEAQKALVRGFAAGMEWEAPWLLERMAEAPDFYFDSCAQVVMESWSRGRIGLLGDAAFCPSPLSGQGTSLAFVGAYVLAGELAADLDTGLKRYETVMREFVEKTQEMGRDNAEAIFAKSRTALRTRYLMMRVMRLKPIAALASRKTRDVVSGIDLPDYRV
ncbi:FAD-dependent monooxygenase [Amycolatopsis umgeniensis]|uniref:2-polyprenyl-6-methoxyphenol hydroxylase-like FAD-dependent oxidoreductase n=1 Tax=Amycolatopsis umgeniensis TaxID=336628 RepID=A0A841B273_9PSEU|nr:FAD-dependent monooxygenase [Amycolatopsis umgeniensis]MBB5853427.1 2-polyprenyl-6-methoxyphenol hydroxylase-like FAD-dependent oxidoreductase [Amycolatopsis umgeniensis]